MRYIRPYNKAKIDSICERYEIFNYTINEDESIDVKGDVFLTGSKLYRSPLKFNKIEGEFFIDYNHLTTLEGCPKSAWSINCSNNQLTSLEGCPEIIHAIYCSSNKITSLKGLPEDFKGQLDCFKNPVSELFGLFNSWTNNGYPSTAENRIAQLINEYDVISQDGKKVYKDNLEEVFMTLDLDIPKDLKFNNYEIH